jgi:mannose-6-phosphate isomerase-like protein (cupin superfamily)
MTPQKLATEQLANFGNHSMMVAHREANGQAELHETQADVFVVSSGEATLVVGGSMVDGRTTAPNEVRGPSINGGEKKKLGGGDMVHIPARVPHQLLVESGKQFTYAVVKIDAR